MQVAPIMAGTLAAGPDRVRIWDAIPAVQVAIALSSGNVSRNIVRNAKADSGTSRRFACHPSADELRRSCVAHALVAAPSRDQFGFRREAIFAVKEGVGSPAHNVGNGMIWGANCRGDLARFTPGDAESHNLARLLFSKGSGRLNVRSFGAWAGSIHATAFKAIARIFAWRTPAKVRGVHAGRVVAGVQAVDLGAGVIALHGDHQAQARGCDEAAAYPHFAITGRVFGREPRPALVRLFPINLHPKSLFDSWLESFHAHTVGRVVSAVKPKVTSGR